MRTVRSLLLILLGSAVLVFSFTQRTLGQSQITDQLHTPAKASPERKAILDAVREEYLDAEREEYKEGADHPAKFLVNYLKVHNGWAWINVTPLNETGKPVGDPAPLLFHSENGKWVNKDLNEVADADDQVGPLDPSPKYIKALRKKYPGVSADIIPKQHK